MSARGNTEQSTRQEERAKLLHPAALPRTPYLPQSLGGVLCGGGGNSGSCTVATHVSPLLSTPRLPSSPLSVSGPPPALPLTLLPEFCSNSPSDHLPPAPGLRRKRRWGGIPPCHVHGCADTGSHSGSHSGSQSGGGRIRCKPVPHAAAAAAAAANTTVSLF